MYDKVTLSKSDISAYATFWSWLQPSHESRLKMISDGFGYENLQAIDREVYALKREKAIDAFDTTLPIKLHMFATVRERGSQAPERVDYTTFLKGAIERKTSPFFKPLGDYKPEPGASGVKLLPAQAVRISYRQESYSDDSEVAIPYVITPGKPADLAVFARNVSALVRRANSHNGMAGSGATYEASVKDGFVIVSCRSSISD